MYNELESKLKEIRKGKKTIITRYSKLLDSKKAIDDYYNENDIDAAGLYERLIILSNKKEMYKTIILPSYISLAFGLFIVGITEIIRYFISTRSQFILNAKATLDKALHTLTDEYAKQAVIQYNDIVNSTLFLHSTTMVVVGVVMIIIALLLVYLPIPINRLNHLKEDVYKYEVDKINEKLSNIEIKNKK